jgi:hypothetical protein
VSDTCLTPVKEWAGSRRELARGRGVFYGEGDDKVVDYLDASTK